MCNKCVYIQSLFVEQEMMLTSPSSFWAGAFLKSFAFIWFFLLNSQILVLGVLLDFLVRQHLVQDALLALPVRQSRRLGVREASDHRAHVKHFSSPVGVLVKSTHAWQTKQTQHHKTTIINSQTRRVLIILKARHTYTTWVVFKILYANYLLESK